ncbi:PrpF domain-containing protein [Pelagibacterium luteolum]|uniref:PrpF family protein n=1 Tax=Pelagibacterium luteolum TaxID=440168 RepID=A0A1G7XV71_9HYPH|nr:PrpF domain-containing protein [Pelagibacterium luteolum]SDG87936.1 hypothetical protein SAMN04487974_11111 [Pelagibacterium luteolum]
MAQRRIPAVFMRGGTSKAVMLKRADLPSDEGLWPDIFLAMLGSPDSYGRQLDGMGGGISSLSKICILAPSDRVDADVDYTFAQVSVTGRQVDFSGNCGNMSSAVGPFAVDEGLVSAPNDGEVLVRIFNTNSGKIIHSRFAVRDGEAVVTGEVGLPGISTRGAPVRLDFLDPAGTTGRGLLPTDSAIETLEIEPGLSIEASLIDAAIPSVFVRADDLGIAPDMMPNAMDADTALMGRLEHIRQQASVKMGLAEDLATAAARIAIPKIALVGAPTTFRTLSGDLIASSELDLCVRMVSAGQAHRAFPITGSLALASAAAVRESTVAKCLKPGADLTNLRLGTPSGVIAVGAQVDGPDGKSIPAIGSASILRTQRRLFEGRITIPDPHHTQ